MRKVKSFLSSFFIILFVVKSYQKTVIAEDSLWSFYKYFLQDAKYIDLTHTIYPNMPVWKQFGPSKQFQTYSKKDNHVFSYKKDKFEATGYMFSTDQLGTQLDPPAHWNPIYPSIDQLPPTFAIRPLVVISIVNHVKKNSSYSLTVEDVLRFERKYGIIPKGSCVFIRSDWSKKWHIPDIEDDPFFPQKGLEALKFLHLNRSILLHGHEPLDTDATPTLEGEEWLLTNGYTQAEGVTNLDKIAPIGCLVTIGYSKLGGGTGTYARYIAICPKSWKYGQQIDSKLESPLPKQKCPLAYDDTFGYRTRAC